MEMMNVMYELATTKSALEMAETTIRKQRGKLLRKNILIAGASLVWLYCLQDAWRERREA